MQIEEALERTKIWIEELIGKELQYITRRNVVVIESVDWGVGDNIICSRGESTIKIRFERFAAVISKLLEGYPVHVDTVLRSGSNDRSVIETVIANFPPVGFILPNNGRNKSGNKVIQWLDNDIHSLGEIKDISSNDYTNLVLSAAKVNISTHLSKPFLLLAGISGTGKTRFVREQAKTSKHFRETYCLSSVRPDWHEPSDLLGYVSRLNGPSEYIATDVLQFIARAWRGILDCGLKLKVQENAELGERLVVEGKRENIDKVLPYWLCLDEMNLAPVEQYFADYLSVLETREWDWQDDGSFTYSSDALLKSSVINDVEKNDELRVALGFGKAEDDKYDELWKMICEHGLGIPFNLIVAGTVNMDETTHGFSRKVIDRALSFDFGEFFPNNFDEFGEFGKQKTRIKRLGYPVWSNARKADVATTSDPDGALSIAFLSKVNNVLKNTPFELAYRALNELLLAVAASQPQDKQALQAVWDDFMMCKVLPRIEGDEDKLAAQNDENLLEKLQKVLENEFDEIWESERPDLYREKLTPEGEAVMVVCRAKKKLNWMNERLGRGFTTFWP